MSSMIAAAPGQEALVFEPAERLADRILHAADPSPSGGVGQSP